MFLVMAVFASMAEHELPSCQAALAVEHQTFNFLFQDFLNMSQGVPLERRATGSYRLEPVLLGKEWVQRSM